MDTTAKCPCELLADLIAAVVIAGDCILSGRYDLADGMLHEATVPGALFIPMDHEFLRLVAHLKSEQARMVCLLTVGGFDCNGCKSGKAPEGSDLLPRVAQALAAARLCQSNRAVTKAILWDACLEVDAAVDAAIQSFKEKHGFTDPDGGGAQ